MAKESSGDLPPEEIGDKKEEQKQSAASAEVKKSIEELKKRNTPQNWLKEKYDAWRHEK